MVEQKMNFKELYAQLEAEGKNKVPKGDKAEKIRIFIRNVAKEVGQEKLLMSALYQMTKKQFDPEKVDRPYFQSIVTKAWEIEKDEKGAVWVFVGKEKRPSPPE